jgi:carbon storage regulator
VLVLSRKPEQSLHLGDNITVTVLAIDGDRVKLGIQAPRSVSVLRHEVFSQIQQANVAAAAMGGATANEIVASFRRQVAVAAGDSSK